MHGKAASVGQGMIPWTPACEWFHPSFLGVKPFAVIFRKIDQNLFVKLFKSLAPGRAAGGVFQLSYTEETPCIVYVFTVAVDRG